MKTALLLAEKAQRKTASDVILIRLTRRKDSRFYQARIRFGSQMLRVSTRTESKAAATEFAELAYRHFRQQIKKTGTITPPLTSR